MITSVGWSAVFNVCLYAYSMFCLVVVLDSIFTTDAPEDSEATHGDD